MHTPGPWTATPSGLITAGQRGLHIAQTATTGMGHAADANARLIAAAPDLLAALLEYVERHESEGNPEGMPEYEQARAAITKATTGA